jgi:drug/metabolite transporter (DMT)-like permease
VVLGLAVAAFWGFGDLLAALAARRVGAFRTVAVAQIAELAICLTVWIAVRPRLPGTAVVIGALLAAGVLTAASYGSLYRGLMLGPVMLVAPIAAAYAIGPTILAVVVLHEHLSVYGAIGAATAIVGVVVVSAGRATAPGPDQSRGGGVPFAFVAMAGFAMSAFMIAAMAKGAGWFATLMISRVGVAATLSVVAVGPARWALRGAAGGMPPRPAGLAALAGVSNLVGTALYARGGELGLVAVVTAVSALFPLVPIFGGYAVFHERVGAIQLFGIAMIILGLVLLG